LVQTAENLRTTVVESFPDSEQAKHYVELARKLRENTKRHSLTRDILSSREIMAVVNKYG
jgi:nitrogenase subunit NifH